MGARDSVVEGADGDGDLDQGRIGARGCGVGEGVWVRWGDCE